MSIAKPNTLQTAVKNALTLLCLPSAVFVKPVLADESDVEIASPACPVLRYAQFELLSAATEEVMDVEELPVLGLNLIPLDKAYLSGGVHFFRCYGSPLSDDITDAEIDEHRPEFCVALLDDCRTIAMDEGQAARFEDWDDIGAGMTALRPIGTLDAMTSKLDAWKLPFLRFGDIAGVHAETLSIVTTTPRPNAPEPIWGVLIGYGGLSPDNEAVIREGYLSGLPLILVTPDAMAVQQLHAITGSPLSLAQREQSLGELAFYVLAQAEDGATARIRIGAVSGDDMFSSQDSTIQHMREFDQLLDWLSEWRDDALQEDVVDASQGSPQTRESPVSKTLQELVATYIDVSPQMMHDKNVHTVSLTSRGAYDIANDYYIVYVRAKGVWNASGSVDPESFHNTTAWYLRHDSGNHRGWFTESYKFTAWPGREPGKNNASIIESLPKNVVNTKEYTSGIKYDLSGSFSGELTGKANGDVGGKVGGKIDGGFSVSTQVKYNVADLTITANSRGDIVEWMVQNEPLDYRWPTAAEIAAPFTLIPGVTWWGYGPIPVKARATFEPEFEWIWKLPGAMREQYPDGIPVHFELASTQRFMHYNLGMSTGVPIVTFPDFLARQELSRNLKTNGVLTVPWPLRPGETR